MAKNEKIKAWIHAFRLRTLPLSLSGIILGTFLAASAGFFKTDIFILAISTTLFLQILSNLANDYGDFINGADNENRVGPQRAVQSGVISPREMKNMIIIFVILSFISGLALLFSAFQFQHIAKILFFLVLGIAAIIAALKYTAGKNPYGYKGLGDIFVFLFFGWVAVAGSYFLFSQQFEALILLPASAIGMFSTGVLNVNNMRDRETDKKVGKITIPVRLGEQNAKTYHLFLIAGAWLLSLLYILLCHKNLHAWIAVLALPPFIWHLKNIFSQKKINKIDPELKKLSLSTLFFAILFGLAILIS